MEETLDIVTSTDIDDNTPTSINHQHHNNNNNNTFSCANGNLVEFRGPAEEAAALEGVEILVVAASSAANAAPPVPRKEDEQITSAVMKVLQGYQWSLVPTPTKYVFFVNARWRSLIDCVNPLMRKDCTLKLSTTTTNPISDAIHSLVLASVRRARSRGCRFNRLRACVESRRWGFCADSLIAHNMWENDDGGGAHLMKCAGAAIYYT